MGAMGLASTQPTQPASGNDDAGTATSDVTAGELFAANTTPQQDSSPYSVDSGGDDDTDGDGVMALASNLDQFDPDPANMLDQPEEDANTAFIKQEQEDAQQDYGNFFDVNAMTYAASAEAEANAEPVTVDAG